MTSERRYEQTHPWIRFRVDLRPAPPGFWMRLGEAVSKCEHVRNVPLLPETARRVQQMYLIRGVVATTAIEGNTLTEDDVREHLEGRLVLPASREYLAREVDNVLASVRGLLEGMAAGGGPPLEPGLILRINRDLLAGLPLDEGVEPGRVRTHSVTVGRYRGAPAEDCEWLLARLCEWLEGAEFRGPDDRAGMDAGLALIRAIVAHVYLAWIHPFGDGNGRTARLVEFMLLVRAGVPASAAHLLSNHYNRTRSEYYRQLEASSRSGGDLLPFISYAIDGFVEELRGQLDDLHAQHRELLWRRHVEEVLVVVSAGARARLAELALALGAVRQVVPPSRLVELTPRVAAAYARRAARTFTRDLAELERLGLIEKGSGGYRARLEVVSALLPDVLLTRPGARG